MEPNDSNPKPQPTGGLKLMTVFIAVLALHVVVIGGFTVWHLLYPTSAEADLAIDKTHKGQKIASDISTGEMAPGDSTTDKPAGTAATVATDAEAPAASSTDTSATASASSTMPASPTMQAPPAAPANPAAALPPVTVSTQGPVEDASAIAANPPATIPIHNGPVVVPSGNLAPPTDQAPANIAADASTAPAATAGTTYVVKKGDSLARIAHRHHLPLAQLRSANTLANDSLHIGQKLMIPDRASKTDDSAPTMAATPAVTHGRTAFAAQPVTAADLSGPETASSTSNSLPKHTSHKTASAATGHHLYTVLKGDTLTKIAKRYHTTTSAIMAANSLSNAGRLSIGQKLHIPSHEARASATAEQAAPEESEHTGVKGQLATYNP